MEGEGEFMKKKILVVDDEELLTKTFSILLEKKLGHEVRVARGGQDAVEMAETQNFDLILCDIRMPGIDGVETLKRLRGIFRQRQIPCPPEIVMTGYADTAKEKEVQELAPAAYLVKPFDNGVLIEQVRKLLA